MVKLGPFLVGTLLLVSILPSASARHHPRSDAKRDPSLLQTELSWVPAIRLGELTESVCFKPIDTDDGMYVAVPQSLFKNGEACGKSLQVSCAEPYRDLGGPWHVCKSDKAFKLRIIDQVLDEPLDDDLFQLSDKAFGRLAIPGVDSLRLILH